MRRNITWLAGVGAVLLLVSTSPASASATTLRPCLTNHKLKVVKGHATMLVSGHRVACKVVKKAKPKPRPSAKPSPTASTPIPSLDPLVRFAGDLMNNLVIRAGLTVTIRNTDAVPHTLVIASEGISVLTPANDISAFLAPSKPGIYTMTTAENPNVKATLTVIP
ncbi:MAG: cupredoxin domain-containing protein [Candidatus Nanopelagicales bacterium]